MKEESNVIIRNIAISKVLADNGDAIGVRKYTHWIDKEALLNLPIRILEQCMD